MHAILDTLVTCTSAGEIDDSVSSIMQVSCTLGVCVHACVHFVLFSCVDCVMLAVPCMCSHMYTCTHTCSCACTNYVY